MRAKNENPCSEEGDEWTFLFYSPIIHTVQIHIILYSFE